MIRIFGEFSKTPKIAELNLTNNLLPLCLKIASDDSGKFFKEARIWALAVVNRGCQHQVNEINIKTMQICLSYLSPSFLRFMLGATDPEDLDFTMNSKGIFTTLEAMCAAKNAQLLTQFSSN